jgi:hypothetical protein
MCTKPAYKPPTHYNEPQSRTGAEWTAPTLNPNRSRLQTSRTSQSGLQHARIGLLTYRDADS